MVSESVRVTLTLGAVLVLAAAGAITWSIVEADPPAPGAAPEAIVTRVIFAEEETRVDTPTMPIPLNGVIEFPPLPITIRNITLATVTLHVEVEGPAVRDTILVTVMNPQGEERSEEHAGPTVNLAGYRHSTPVIWEWRHATKPKDLVYETQDRESAERWSALNHTDTRGVGMWTARVEITPGEFPGTRIGNVTLSFLFRHYAGAAVLEDPRPPQQSVDRTPEAPPAERVAEGAPRTFITEAGLGRVVDRGPGPHGPL